MTALRRETVAGWEALVLENDALRVTVLPDKGADIYALVDLASGLDVLFKGPWGLQPPGSQPLEGSGGDAFMWNYEGTWQELFPSVNPGGEFRGRQVPFHGEVATLAWDREEVSGGVRLSVRSRQLPLRLERVMRLPPGERALVLEETVTNEGDEPAPFVWGHHCVLGGPLVAAGARLHVPARTLETQPEVWEETARLEPGQRSQWPHGRLRSGGTVDLRDVPGPEAGSHDDVYLTDLSAGWVAVSNPRLEVAFRLDFDPDVFPWVIVWQPYGGALEAPLTGAYALGVEPWVSRRNLPDAVAAGDALELGPGESLSTTVRAEVGPESIVP